MIQLDTLTNAALDNWANMTGGVKGLLSRDYHRDILYWGYKLLLAARYGNGSHYPSVEGKARVGCLVGSQQHPDPDVAAVYESFYDLLVNDVPMNRATLVGFLDVLELYDDKLTDALTIERFETPLSHHPDVFLRSITQVLALGSKWVQSPKLETVWATPFSSASLPKDTFSLWYANPPTLWELLNAHDSLLTLITDLPVFDHVGFCVRYGHDYRFPVYQLPTPEQSRYGIGLRIRNLYLFPEGDLVAKALSAAMGSGGRFTMYCKAMGYATEFCTSAVGGSYRVDQSAASERHEHPSWLRTAFPEKTFK